jgi:hypothetical protein
MHATSIGISDVNMKRLTRWRSIESAAGRAASLPGGTKESYAEIGQMLRSLIRASRPL